MGSKPHDVHDNCGFHASDSECRLLFASVVIGMGTDQKKLYRVARIGQPRDLTEWAQELGRSGRDGKRSVATLLRGHVKIEKLAFG